MTMTKEQVLETFPIGSTVKPKDGTPFYGGRRTGVVSKISGYNVAFLGLRYMIEIDAENGSSLGDYHPHELEQA